MGVAQSPARSASPASGPSWKPEELIIERERWSRLSWGLCHLGRFLISLLQLRTAVHRADPFQELTLQRVPVGGILVLGGRHLLGCRADTLEPWWKEPWWASWARRQLVSFPRSLQDGQNSAGVTLRSNFGFRTIGILESCF